MAKKKQNMDLKNKNISYTQDNTTFKVVYLNASNMTVDVECFKNNVLSEKITLPFAHLPKKIKSLINPL